MKQNEITSKQPLLDANGNVANPGYCVTSNYIYDRKAIKADPWRIKEWNFYQISDDRYTVQMNFSDVSYAGFGKFKVFDRLTGECVDALGLDLFTKGKYNMPECDEVDHEMHCKKKDFDFRIEVIGEKRYLKLDASTGKHGRIEASFELICPKKLEYLMMAVPFKKAKQFYLNKKMNCMPAKGYVKFGDKTWNFDAAKAFGVLDWGRGVWPYKCDWYWGNGSTYLPDGKIFGFEIGWGFGEMEQFTENTLFYDGKAHKIEKITLHRDEKDFMKPWVFSSSDGRFEMTMIPEYDNFNDLGLKNIFGMKTHQVHGKWSGQVILDDGTKIDIKDMHAFCEYSDNRW